MQEIAHRLHISLHFSNGLVSWQYFLLLIQMMSGVILILGYKTRAASAVAWILTISLHNRNFLILNGGDVLLRMLLFWSVFLPLGAVGSLDSLRTQAISDRYAMANKKTVFSGGSIAIIIQIMFVYIFTALLKTGREWWPDGTASFYALSLDSFVTPFGQWLSQWTNVLQFSTYIVYFLELLGPLVWLSPIYFVKARVLSIAAFMLIHLNFDLAMRLGLFPWVDMASLLILIPSENFDTLQKIIKKNTTLISAGWKNHFLEITQSFLKKNHSLQSGYHSINSKRAALKYLDSFQQWIGHILAIFCIGYIGIINLNNLPNVRIIFLHPWDKIGTVLRFDQKWNMFAPFPIREDGWFVVAGRLKVGSSIDILRYYLNQEKISIDKLSRQDLLPISYDKPKNVAYENYSNAHWRKFLLSLKSTKKKSLRRAYAKYLCRFWNRDILLEDLKLQELDIYFMEEYSLPPGEKATIRKKHLWHEQCIDQE